MEKVEQLAAHEAVVGILMRSGVQCLQGDRLVEEQPVVAQCPRQGSANTALEESAHVDDIELLFRDLNPGDVYHLRRNGEPMLLNEAP